MRTLRSLLSRNRLPLLAWIAVLALGSLALGLALGRATVDPGRASTTPTASPPTLAMSATPSIAPTLRVVDGVPEGFPETSAGALAAALGFLGVEVSDGMGDPAAYRAAWREMCTPAYFDATGRAAAEAVISGQESANHLVSNAASRQVVYERIFPLTAAVTAMSGSTATVQTWSLLVAHPGDGPTTVSFSAGTLALRWWAGNWKLDGGSGSSAKGDGASGALRLDDGPALPRYLGQLAGVDDAPAH
jgi:hypothetical protein